MTKIISHRNKTLGRKQPKMEQNNQSGYAITNIERNDFGKKRPVYVMTEF